MLTTISTVATGGFKPLCEPLRDDDDIDNSEQKTFIFLDQRYRASDEKMIEYLKIVNLIMAT